MRVDVKQREVNILFFFNKRISYTSYIHRELILLPASVVIESGNKGVLYTNAFAACTTAPCW